MLSVIASSSISIIIPMDFIDAIRHPNGAIILRLCNSFAHFQMDCEHERTFDFQIPYSHKLTNMHSRFAPA